MNKRLLCGLLIPLIVMVVIFIPVGQVAAVAYPVGITPEIDAKIFVGSTPSGFNTDTFLSDLEDELNSRGIDSSRINVTYASTSEVSATNSTNWITYDNVINEGEQDTSGQHYPDPYEALANAVSTDRSKHPHILSTSSGTLGFLGYGRSAYKNFMISSDNSVSNKRFKFTLDENGVNYHSMEGGGFIFGVEASKAVSGSSFPSDTTMSGYALIVTSGAIVLYKFENVNMSNLNKTTSNTFAGYSGVTQLKSYTRPSTKRHDFIIDVINGVLSFKDNGSTIESGYSLPTSYGNRFGPFVSFGSHGCYMLSWFAYENLVMSTTTQVTTDVVTWFNSANNWMSGADKYLINLGSTIPDTLDTSDETSAFSASLKTKDVDYIGISDTGSSSMHDAIIAGNADGIRLGFSESNLAIKVADYIIIRVVPQIEATVGNTDLTVSFDKNGGTGVAMASLTKKFGDSVALTKNTYTRTGYSFAGWATSSTGAAVYADEGSFTMPAGNMPLYAVWARSVNLAFNSNTGEGSMETLSVKSGTAIKLPQNTLTKVGFQFAGWATSAAGDVEYTDGANFTVPDVNTTTLYAVWEVPEQDEQTEAEPEVFSPKFDLTVPSASNNDSSDENPGYRMDGYTIFPAGPGVLTVSLQSDYEWFSPTGQKQLFIDEQARFQTVSGQKLSTHLDRLQSGLIIPEFFEQDTASVTLCLIIDSPLAPDNSKAIEQAKESLKNANQLFIKSFDLSLWKTIVKSNNLSAFLPVNNDQITGDIFIHIPVEGDLLKYQNFYVMHITPEGLMERVPTTLITDNGRNYIEFSTNHFSTYAIGSDPNAPAMIPEIRTTATNQTSDSSTQYPKTGEADLALILLAVGILGLVALKKARRRSRDA